MFKKDINPNNSSRSKLYLVYFLLAAFNILTLLIALYLNHRIMGIYTKSVADNQEWVQRLAKYSELGEIAGAINAPGNDIFDSHNAAAESERMRAAL